MDFFNEKEIVELLLRILQRQDDQDQRFFALDQNLHLANQQIRNVGLVEAQILNILKSKAVSGTVTFGGDKVMDISVHLSDVPKVASAHEWTGPLGTGVEVPPVGAISWASDNAAAVTVDPNTGQLAYVGPGVANISFTDAGNSITGSGSVTVSADLAVSGTVTFA